VNFGPIGGHDSLPEAGESLPAGNSWQPREVFYLVIF